MTLARLWWPAARRAVALAALAAVVLAGCSAAGATDTPEASVVAFRVDAPIHTPIWSHEAGALVALTEDGSRIAKITPTAGAGSPPAARTALSPPLRDAGENLTTSPTGHDVLYVPQPRLDRIAVVSVGDLRRVSTLRAGPSPSYVATDSGARMLLAAPTDGSTVTAVDLRDNETLPAQRVRAGPLVEIDGSKRGRRIAYHVAGPRGIAHYKGSPFSVTKKGEIAVSAETAAGDLIKPSRVYVAESGTDRLFAVDSMRSLHGLEVVAQARMGEPVLHLGVDEARIYAATQNELIALETNSYEGYDDNIIPVVATVDFRGALESAELKAAPLSGLTVGPDRVYLTLQRQPYVVSIAKPGV